VYDSVSDHASCCRFCGPPLQSVCRPRLGLWVAQPAGEGVTGPSIRRAPGSALLRSGTASQTLMCCYQSSAGWGGCSSNPVYVGVKHSNGWARALDIRSTLHAFLHRRCSCHTSCCAPTTPQPPPCLEEPATCQTSVSGPLGFLAYAFSSCAAATRFHLHCLDQHAAYHAPMSSEA
jgi:hypothetical protein